MDESWLLPCFVQRNLAPSLFGEELASCNRPWGPFLFGKVLASLHKSWCIRSVAVRHTRGADK